MLEVIKKIYKKKNEHTMVVKRKDERKIELMDRWSGGMKWICKDYLWFMGEITQLLSDTIKCEPYFYFLIKWKTFEIIFKLILKPYSFPFII